MKQIVLAILFYIYLLIGNSGANGVVISGLRESTVLVESANAYGSGILFTRGTNSYVLTAAHVVRSSLLVQASGVRKVQILEVSRPLFDNEVNIGRLCSFVEVLKFSDEEDGDDLCLLKVTLPNFFTNSIKFYSDKKLPIGSPLFHIGNMAGKENIAAITAGIYAQKGKTIMGKKLDVGSFSIMGGSSGGPVITQDGQIYGIVTMTDRINRGIFVPIDKIKLWTERQGCSFLFDESKETPDNDIVLDPNNKPPMSILDIFK